MSFLIFSNISDLKKIKSNGSIKISIKGFETNGQSIKSGENVFFYNGDTSMIYGTGTIRRCENLIFQTYDIQPVKDSPSGKSIKKGPVLTIDGKGFNRRGFKAGEISGDYHSIMAIDRDEERWFLEKLLFANRKFSRILIGFLSRPAEREMVSSIFVYRADSGLIFRNFNFRINPSVKSEVRDKVKTIERYLRKDKVCNVRDYLMDTGKIIYDGIFKNINLDFLWETGNYLIDLYVEDNKFFLPLELACKNERFLFEENVISVKGRNDYREIHPVKIKKVLLLGSTDNGLVNPVREVKEIYDFFAGEYQGTNFELRLVARPYDFESLKNHLKKTDIVHFCGHIDNRETKRIKTGFLAGALSCLHSEERPGFVFLNGCGHGYSTGLQLLSAGIQCCIASRHEIPDILDAGFNTGFYSFIKQGFPVSYAFNRALNIEFSMKHLLPISYSFFGNSRISYEM